MIYDQHFELACLTIGLLVLLIACLWHFKDIEE